MVSRGPKSLDIDGGTGAQSKGVRAGNDLAALLSDLKNHPRYGVRKDPLNPISAMDRIDTARDESADRHSPPEGWHEG